MTFHPTPRVLSGVYVASRVKHAELWKKYRAAGTPIISSWIDEAGDNETDDFGELWERIHREIAASGALVFYAAGQQDFPFKGALVEVGIALALGKPVYAVLNNVQIEGRTMRPVGSWLLARNVKRFVELDDALISASLVPSERGEKLYTKADIEALCAIAVAAANAAPQVSSVKQMPEPESRTGARPAVAARDGQFDKQETLGSDRCRMCGEQQHDGQCAKRAPNKQEKGDPLATLLACINMTDGHVQKMLRYVYDQIDGYAETFEMQKVMIASLRSDLSARSESLAARRYERLRILGCAPSYSKHLENGTVLRFTGLDEFVDEDLRLHKSRGEYEDKSSYVEEKK